MSQRAQYLGKGVGTSGPVSEETHRVLWDWKYIELFSEDLKYMAKAENPTHIYIFIFHILMVLETLSKEIKFIIPFFI